MVTKKFIELQTIVTFQISRDTEPTVTNLKPVKSSIAGKPLVEKQTTANFIGDITLAEEKYFITGSSYKGSWDALGMAGVGRYVMPNGQCVFQTTNLFFNKRPIVFVKRPQHRFQQSLPRIRRHALNKKKTIGV